MTLPAIKFLSINQKEETALEILEHFYLNDDRPFCVAYSGGKEFYNKGGEENPKYGMTMPKGMTLKIRKEAFKRTLKLQSKLNEKELIC